MTLQIMNYFLFDCPIYMIVRISRCQQNFIENEKNKEGVSISI